MNVYFIAHGSTAIGMGHVMRSLSLAKVFRERRHNVYFFSKYKLGIDEMEKQGFKATRIPIQSEKYKAEDHFFCADKEILKEAEHISSQIVGIADAIIVDSYNVNEKYFDILREKTKQMVYIDDLNAFCYPVDILINGSASAFEMGYENIQTAKLLLGLRYNLLRKEFYNIPERIVKTKVKDILITTGNSDPFHMTEQLINILKEEHAFKDLKIHVVKGSGFALDSLADIKRKDDAGILLYDKPADIAEIMLKCDLAITAGGSTLYELFACGVPPIVFAYAENQVPQINALEKEGLLMYVGVFSDLKRKKLMEYIRYMQSHYEERKKLINEIQKKVDARGALRIAEEIEGDLGIC